MFRLSLARRGALTVSLAVAVLAAVPAAAQQPRTAGGAPPARAPIDYGTARLERQLEVMRAAGRIELDGALDEPSWAAAPIAHGFIQNDPREGEPATYDTEVRVLYDDEALYFGVFARDDQPSRIVINDLKKDFSTDNSDGFRIVLDTFHDSRNAYEFAVNPAGAKWDAQMTNEGQENNSSWDGIWDVKTRVVETGWYAEIRIPFRTLKFNPSDIQTWGLNFERKVRRLNEDSYWAPLPRIYGPERVSLAGTVDGLRGLHAGKNLRFKPYVSSASNAQAGKRTDGDFDGGFDAKYGVTTGLVWDFTVNTDFSQAEADEQQINLTRLNVLFPEKRDFFLENSGIFQFGGGGRNNGGNNGGGGQNANAQFGASLFFSRRIGLSDNGEPPLGPAGTLLGRRAEHAAAAARRHALDQLHDRPRSPRRAGQLQHRRDRARQGSVGTELQPRGRRRREFPLRVSDADRVAGQELFADARGAGHGKQLRVQRRRQLQQPHVAVPDRLQERRRLVQRRDGIHPA